MYNNFVSPFLHMQCCFTPAYCLCIIRSKAAINSEPWRPPNPEHVGHPFRAKAATFYGKLESVADINRNLK